MAVTSTLQTREQLSEWVGSVEKGSTSSRGGLIVYSAGNEVARRNVLYCMRNLMDSLTNNKNRTLIVCQKSSIDEWCGILGGESGVQVVSCKFSIQLLTASKRVVVVPVHRVYHSAVARAVARIAWHRVVFDDAHFGRSAGSKTHAAMMALVGKWKWAISHSPYQNSPKDVDAIHRWIHNKDCAQNTAFFDPSRAKLRPEQGKVAHLDDHVTTIALSERERQEYDAWCDTRDTSSPSSAFYDEHVGKISHVEALLRRRQACNHGSICMQGVLKKVESGVAPPLTEEVYLSVLRAASSAGQHRSTKHDALIRAVLEDRLDSVQVIVTPWSFEMNVLQDRLFEEGIECTCVYKSMSTDWAGIVAGFLEASQISRVSAPSRAVLILHERVVPSLSVALKKRISHDSTSTTRLTRQVVVYVTSPCVNPSIDGNLASVLRALVSSDCETNVESKVHLFVAKDTVDEAAMRARADKLSGSGAYWTGLKSLVSE